MKKSLIILCTILFTFSYGFCQEKSEIQNFDFGTAKAGLYENDFFKLKISFNPEWSVQSQEQIDKLTEIGEDIIYGEDKQMKRIINSSKVNISTLLTIYQYELGSAVDYNPSFMVIAENTKLYTGVKTGKDYLFHAKNMLIQTAVGYSFKKDVYERKIGNVQFHVLEGKVEMLGKKISQDYMATVKNGFSLLFITTYTNKEEKEELYKIIEKITMEN